jgi:hypothetical protein
MRARVARPASSEQESAWRVSPRPGDPLPSIREDLDASFTDLQWVVDAYTLALAALVLTAGSLADRFGRRRLFATGLVRTASRRPRRRPRDAGDQRSRRE